MIGAILGDIVGSIYEFDNLKSKDFENGRFHIEDKACQIACKVLDLQPGERVLDTCAAPGGKTFTLAQYGQFFP